MVSTLNYVYSDYLRHGYYNWYNMATCPIPLGNNDILLPKSSDTFLYFKQNISTKLHHVTMFLRGQCPPKNIISGVAIVASSAPLHADAYIDLQIH